jgi:hypothetical protein
MYRRTIQATVALAGLALLTAAWAAPLPPTPPTMTAALARRVKFEGINDPKATLEEVLDKLSKQYDLTFDVNERAFAFENAKDVLKTEVATPSPLPAMKNVRLDTALRKVLARVPVPSGATFTLREDRIEITTNTFQGAEVWGKYNGAHLPLVNATLDRAPLEDALRELAAQADFNVVLDNRTAEKARTPVTARLRNTPLDTAVRLLADMAELRPVHLDNALYVTSRENASVLEARLEKEKTPTNPTDDPESGLNIRKGSGPGVITNTAPMAGM